MRKTTLMIMVILTILAVSLPARAPSLSSERPSAPPIPFNVTGLVEYNGFNLKACDGSAGECLDLVATCGTYTYTRITIFFEQDGKSYYSAEVPGDDLETLDVKEACATGEIVTFTLKGEVPAQTPITWEAGGREQDYNLAIGSPKMVFLPMIRR